MKSIDKRRHLCGPFGKHKNIRAFLNKKNTAIFVSCYHSASVNPGSDISSSWVSFGADAHSHTQSKYEFCNTTLLNCETIKIAMNDIWTEENIFEN